MNIWDKLKELDWKDIGLHAIGGVVLVWLLSFVFSFIFAILVNMVFWGVREVWQDWQKGHRWPDIWPKRYSSQKWAEFAVPSIIPIIIL